MKKPHCTASFWKKRSLQWAAQKRSKKENPIALPARGGEEDDTDQQKVPPRCPGVAFYTFKAENEIPIASNYKELAEIPVQPFFHCRLIDMANNAG